ncbi:Lar family restriction alleviation protein [Blautia sp. MSJ-9]|uniref:Lar family restriction alleviation protein n=1 Tax=Blautia sp. MSJ-9 TaxID=2841511 RepID=UPI001C1173B6|nr:Lar family restriction alleviation protein [Blautia sp. MSJ-9]
MKERKNILLPCPFCGGTAYFKNPVRKGLHKELSVECKRCGAAPYTLEVYGNKSNEEMKTDLAAVWNRRGEKENDWIPVSKKTPEYDKPVLAQWRIFYSDIDQMDILYMNGFGEWYSESGDIYGKVIAWKLLPEPYKEE